MHDLVYPVGFHHWCGNFVSVKSYITDLSGKPCSFSLLWGVGVFCFLY